MFGSEAMKFKSWVFRWVLLMASLCFGNLAWAQSCTLSAASTTLTGYNTGSNLLSAVLTVGYTCTRSKNGASMTMNVNAGVSANYLSPQRRMKDTVSNTFVNYDLLRTTTLTTLWGNGTIPSSSSPITVSILNNSFPTGNATTVSGTFNYFVNIPSGQTPVVGTYTDIVQLTGTCSETNGANTTNCASPITSSNLTVNLTVSGASCSMSTVPNMSLVYTSFQNVAAQAVSNYTVNCTSSTPYWVSLDSAAASQAVATTSVNGTASNNINYTLSIPPTQTTVLTGSGVQQNLWVIGTAAANQSGTCATTPCTSTAQQHMVYINY
jgi:spore coat protein U-like protein